MEIRQITQNRKFFVRFFKKTNNIFFQYFNKPQQTSVTERNSGIISRHFFQTEA